MADEFEDPQATYTRRQWAGWLAGSIVGLVALGGILWHRFAPDTVTTWDVTGFEGSDGYIRSVAVEPVNKLEDVALRGPGRVFLRLRLGDPGIERPPPTDLAIDTPADETLQIADVAHADGRLARTRVETRPFDPVEGSYTVRGLRDGRVVERGRFQLRSTIRRLPLT